MGSRRSRTPLSEILNKAKLAVLLLFVASRVPIALTEPPGSTMAGVNVLYGYEVERAAALGLSFYELHARNRQDADPSGSPTERLVEYPPLTILWMAMPTWFLDPIAKTGMVPDRQVEAAKQANRFAMLAVDLCGFALLLLTGASAVRLGVYAAGGLLLFPVLYERSDLLLGFLALAAVMLLLRRLPVWAPLGMLALAVNLKVTPLVLAPLFVLGTLPAEAMSSASRIARRAAFLALLTAAIFAPFLARDGLVTLDFLRYHVARGLQIESVWSTMPVLLAALFRIPSGTPIRFGAVELDSALAGVLRTLSTIATVALIPVLSVVLWKKIVGQPEPSATRIPDPPLPQAQANPSLFSRYALVFLLTAIAVAPVFSPQYLLWVLPLVAMWDGRRPCLVWAGFFVICALTSWCYPFNYTALLLVTQAGKGFSAGYRLLGAAPLVARNLLLVGLTVVCWRDTASAAPAGSIAPDATPAVPAARRTRAR